jgi:hypothetical protein
MANEEIRLYSVKERSLEEGNKLFYDVFKHLTTLSTGSILILVAFLENLFVDPQYKFRNYSGVNLAIIFRALNTF